MKFKAYTGITWSVLELTGLLEDEDSQVDYKRIKKHLGLHPFHLTNLDAAINEILSSNLNSYDPELSGFLLAYKNPKLLTSLGETFYDTCFIHVDVEADFYIFKPEVGCSMRGIVNKKGLDHIGVLVHKAFNVSIPKPDGEDDWPGDKIEIGQEIRFTITHLDFSSKLPYIRGALDKEDYLRGCKLVNNIPETLNRRSSVDSEHSNGTVSSKVNVKSKPFFNSDSENSSVEDVEEDRKFTSKKGAKKNKSKSTNNILSNDESHEDKSHVKKSKKAKKESNRSIKSESAFNTSLNNESAANDLEEDITPENRSINEPMDAISSESTSIENKPLKPEKDNKAKSSKKSSNADIKNDLPKIKTERLSIISDAETSTGKNTPETKKKKRSLKKKHSDDIEEDAEPPVKNRSKRFKTSVSEDDTPANIKFENLSSTTSAIKEVSETEESAEGVSYKKKLKKLKNSLKSDDDVRGMETKSPTKNSPKKRSRKSDITDSESEKQQAAQIKIKTEKFSETTEDEINSKQNATSNNESTLNDSDAIMNNVESDSEKKKSKKGKKQNRRITEIVKTEPDLANITIKSEKIDDVVENGTALKKGRSPKSPTIDASKSSLKNIKIEGENKHNRSPTKQSHKLKKSESGSGLHNIKIKVEKLTEESV